MTNADGIMPLTRQLGDYFEREPEPELTTITGPQRPTQGRWPADVWAEMQAIYQGRQP